MIVYVLRKISQESGVTKIAQNNIDIFARIVVVVSNYIIHNSGLKLLLFRNTALRIFLNAKLLVETY